MNCAPETLRRTDLGDLKTGKVRKGEVGAMQTSSIICDRLKDPSHQVFLSIEFIDVHRFLPRASTPPLLNCTVHHCSVFSGDLVNLERFGAPNDWLILVD